MDQTALLDFTIVLHTYTKMYSIFSFSLYGLKKELRL